MKILDWWRAKSCQSFIQCSIKTGWGGWGGLRNGSYTCTEQNACIPRGQTGCKSLCKITSFQRPRGRSIPVHADVVWWEMKDDECRRTQGMSEPGPREGGSCVFGATENKVKNCLRMDLFLLHHSTSWVMSLLSVSPPKQSLWNIWACRLLKSSLWMLSSVYSTCATVWERAVFVLDFQGDLIYFGELWSPGGIWDSTK